MRALVGALRLAHLTLHGLHGLAIVGLRFPTLDAAARQRHIQWWAAKQLRVLGIGLQTSGMPRPGAKLVAANHVSWLDVAAIHATAPDARFVSKADVKRWPLLGRLVAAADTLFIERESKRDALRVVHRIAAALEAGDTVAVFPEGTTGAGPEPLPFHANLLQAAIGTRSVVQPVALRYFDPRHGFSPSAQFVGATTLLQSLWQVACADRLSVSVVWIDTGANDHADRRALAAALRETIADALTAPIERP